MLCGGPGEVSRVFLGTHTPRLDEKGRLILPAKYRDELSAGLVLTKGQERCLYVFPVSEFGRITDALRTAPVTAKAVRDYSRVFFASASDEELDKQGRITIPPRSEEHTSELQSHLNLVCRLLLEKKNRTTTCCPPSP